MANQEKVPVPQLRQVAALPWRPARAGIDIMLITSRQTRRWVIPKGWAIAGLPEHGAAAQEAWEEAGVEGISAISPIGFYDYDKRGRQNEAVRIRVDVYAFEVLRQRARGPEHGQRARHWFAPSEAASLVQERTLAQLLMAAASSLR